MTGARGVVGLTCAAILLRLALFLGRGDYLAFDEGWYLLLGRSLWTGDGYSLVGTPHLTLSPLFPLLAGGVGRAIGNWVWGGRIVAAVASGLVVVPVWSLCRRWTDARTAIAVAALVAVTPSLAPFVAAYWVGADLWVGAEPLLHLALYSGLALWTRAVEDGARRWWVLAGVCLGLAFLARPEALGVAGVIVLWSIGVSVRSRARPLAVGTLLLAAGVGLTALPYWSRLHALTGSWHLTGREVDVASAWRVTGASASPATDIERMLVQDDGAYEARLYALDASGLEMRSAYWGLPRTTPGVRSMARPARTPGDTRPSDVGGATGASTGTDEQGPTSRPGEAPSLARLILIAAVTLVPSWGWLPILVGLLVTIRQRRSTTETGATIALVATSLTVGAVAAIDPRTQLFLVPLLVLWMVRGIDAYARRLQARYSGLRPDFVRTLGLGTALVAGLGILGWQFGMSRAVGSPHQVVGAQNRRVGEAVDSLLDGRPGPIASWHPAIAVFADRDWRPIPLAGLPEVVRYEQAVGATGMVLSAYYPPTRGAEVFGARYTVLPVPPGPPTLAAWTVTRVGGDALVVRARIDPSPASGRDGSAPP